jgi:hypothetical protein
MKMVSGSGAESIPCVAIFDSVNGLQKAHGYKYDKAKATSVPA